jgi:chromosome segregation ATPase
MSVRCETMLWVESKFISIPIQFFLTSNGRRAVASLEACEKGVAEHPMDIDTTDTRPMQLPSPANLLPVADEDTVAHMERLLAAVDRLRAERDNLRHDVQFLESESRFAIEALEAKLSQSISTANNTENHATVGQLRAEMDDMHSQMRSYRQQYSVNLSRKNRDIQRLGLQVQALSIALGHVTPQVDPSIGSLEDLKRTRAPNIASISQESLVNSVAQYDVTHLSLQTIIGERDHLLQQLQNADKHWEQEVDTARMAEHEARERLDEALREIDELNEHIDGLESERDSLTLQVTNLMSDLEAAQSELTNAESRYTNLQFHQLNTMTSSEATRTLREHIEELEGRVLRRTEQIGIHQHDIRRLETNLRLQEERLNEMGNELEMMAAQKAAMVEDCADAREARNEAQSRAEALEEEIEALEERTKEDMEALVMRNKTEVEALEERNREDKVLVTTLITVIADTITSARASIRAAKAQAAKLQDTLSGDHEHSSELQKELDEKIAGLLSLTKESEEQRSELENIRISLSESQTEISELSSLAERLQDEKAKLESQLSEMQEAGPHLAVADLEVKNKELQERVEELEHLGSPTTDDAQQGVEELKQQHTQALANLEDRLAEAERALDEVQARYNASSEEHSKATDEAKVAIEELERKLEESTKSLSDLRALQAQASAHDQEHSSKILELQDQLAKSEVAHRDALMSLENIQAENTRLNDELAQTHEEQDSLVSRAVEEQEASKKELEHKVQTLQGRFEEETQLLNMSNEEVARLTVRLQEVSDKLSAAEHVHTESLASSNERTAKAEAAAADLRDELAVLHKNRSQTQDQISAIEEEKSVLQQEITVHEAEAQKSRSLVRYLEGQVKDK